jgi:hypothetical protein
MRILADGTVISSHLDFGGQTTAGEIYRANFSIKAGTIFDIHYPEQATNLSKRFVEYDVRVVESRHDGSVSTVVYQRCLVSDKFGSSNNFEHFTLQAASEKEGELYKNGAQVLVMALNGNANSGNAIIVGGVSAQYGTDPKKDDGQFYEWQFNGINVKVDKDGQYSLTFNSVIGPDGKKADDKAAGTQLMIYKDGRMKIADNEGQSWEIDRVNKKSTWGNGNDSIVIDKKNKKINIISSGDMAEDIKNAKTVKSGKDHSIETTGGNISEKSSADIKQDAKGNISQKSGGNVDVTPGANFQVKAGGSIKMESSGIAQIKGAITMIGDGAVLAAGVGISQCLGIGALGVPVLSTIISGSSSVLIGT